MIKIENTAVFNWEGAIRGMRNPMNSWDLSDTTFHAVSPPTIGENDHKLMMKLRNAGSDHRKYLRQIFVSVDITAPLYWWKEFDTYKVGTVANSCSTMHKIHDKEFTLDDFSHEHLKAPSRDMLENLIEMLNHWRDMYSVSSNIQKDYWWQMIQLLPSSYNQKRTITMNYENLISMYFARKSHKLDEWRDYCKWIEVLPYSELITGEEK